MTDATTPDDFHTFHDRTFYDRTAEFVATLLPAAWAALGPALSRALDGLDTSTGPVVDVGAGSGESTAALARALPDAEILAVEPHPALRTALVARIAGDADLAGRVTVLGTDVLSAALPERISGLVAMNVIGHLPPGERRALWGILAAKLHAGGLAVLNLYPPTRPESVPAAAMGEVTLGRRGYTGTAAAEPAGEEAVTWHMTYRTTEDGRLVDEFTASDLWYVFTPERLAAELAGHGLRVTAGDSAHGLQLITR
ncbi:class I SAM-dependent methyltransferase [Streptomyces sp. N2-109]|uniref:Class I SAM-dependent methyltransferase n=1 Tax=Streptomyces gossypii TaxID=2883101 RepID=A0ABT2JT25_9ACTN|nr:class I SAM-dependent methyltransferase [Streptomyces gossypii]MCT2590853.1 class I SAM-dependent methyltransferase [Streptomyces gossypii]